MSVRCRACSDVSGVTCALCEPGKLRAQLAAMTKERDALRACYVSKEALMLHGMTMEQAVEWRHKARILEGERDAALARVAKLEAALEPTFENVSALWQSFKRHAGEGLNHDDWPSDQQVEEVLGAVRRVAGLDGEEG